MYGACNGITCIIRMAYRKQKRWWNAYILFYERVDEVDNEKHIYKTLQDLTIGLCTLNLLLNIRLFTFNLFNIYLTFKK